ncbi:MAG TPA: hypothetical protein VGB94_14140 [Acidobacteriaceae bacterium]
MPELFADSRRRIRRAVGHGKAFKEQWESLLHPESFATSVEVDGDWRSGVVKATPAAIPDHDLALELGEFFYQLRAALDGAIYTASALAEGINPPSNQDRVEFPICTTVSKFDSNAVNRLPFPEVLRDWIETIQPYNTAKTANTTYSNLNEALLRLHDCARKDRHRRLHVVVAAPRDVQWQFAITPPGKVVDVQALDCNFLEGETVFMRFMIEGINPKIPCKINLITAVTMEVAIEELPTVMGGNIGIEMDKILRATEFVIDTFESGYQ